MSTELSDQPLESQKIAITATFTAEPLEKALAFWMKELEMPTRIEFAPYNQVLQQLLDPSSLLSTNRNGVNVVLVRFEDWQRSGPDARVSNSQQRVERNLRELATALTVAAERLPTPYLICLCPGSPAQAADPQQSSFLKQMEALLISVLSGLNGLQIVPTSELAAAYPVTASYDAGGDQLGHIPFTPLFFTALGTMIARKVYGLKNSRYKVIVLDGDQTLWGGVCGEDGALGIEIGPRRRAIQEFMVEQHDAGMLLCLCSKNNAEDVVQVFEQRTEMVLQRRHFVAWRVNWKPKSENIKSLAQELQVGLESFIFIDDDPLECAEVQASCPEVLTLQLPGNSDLIPRFLRNLWVFDRGNITEEGGKRTALYKENFQRDQFRKQAPTFEEFLAGLRLKIQISPLAPHQLARVSELTNRTNQFNFTTIRRSEAEIKQLCELEGAECLVVHAKDRFGNYGFVGVVIFKVNADAMSVDTFLLSCRALGRRVQHRMLASLGEIARERGLDHIDIPYVRTPKNQPALDFMESLGVLPKEPLDDGLLFRLPVGFAAAVSDHLPVSERTHVSVSGSAPSPAGSSVFGANAQAKAWMLSSIATELCDADQIQKVVSERALRQPKSNTTYVAPHTDIERKLAEIYAEFLDIEQVGIHDSFFELGGHSLLATQVLSRIREAFQVELSPRLFFASEFTVAEMARQVMKQQIKRADPRAALAKRLNELSDEEVKALLAIKKNLTEK
jgi:FkbH-like protein